MESTTIDSILASVKMECGIETSNYDSWLKLRINDIVRTFNIFETYKEKCAELQVEHDNWLCLPNDYYALGELRAKCCLQWNGQEIVREGQFVYYDDGVLKDWGWNNGYAGCNTGGTYKIVGNRIKLAGEFQTVLSAKLYYTAYNTDCFGKFFTPIAFEYAVMLKVTSIFLGSPMMKGQYPQEMIQRYRVDAKVAYDQVVANSRIQEAKRQAPQLKDISNAILIDYRNRR